jgi:periplasmic iron binding protein
MMTMKQSSLAALAAAALGVAFFAPAAHAGEFYIGEPVTKEFLQLSPAYLTGIEMDGHPPGMSMDPNAIHIEIDIHAAANEPHGFPEDAWIPNLTVELTVEKKGGNYSESKILPPMQAIDGPHYANNFAMDGPGEYTVTYVISPPNLIRHIDKATGVPKWWEPITTSWTFTYPSKPNN